MTCILRQKSLAPEKRKTARASFSRFFSAPCAKSNPRVKPGENMQAAPRSTRSVPFSTHCGGVLQCVLRGDMEGRFHAKRSWRYPPCGVPFTKRKPPERQTTNKGRPGNIPSGSANSPDRPVLGLGTGRKAGSVTQAYARVNILCDVLPWVLPTLDLAHGTRRSPRTN